METEQQAIVENEAGIHNPGIAPTSRHRRYIPGFCQMVLAVAVLVVLMVLSWPCLAGVGDQKARTAALSRAKQIALALKLFAMDYDGVYPKEGVPPKMKTAPVNSNEAFACLMPLYTSSEALFGNSLSAYQTRIPDNIIDNPYTGTPVKTLEPGENVYAYVMGLTESDNPGTPLITDGTDGTGHYRSDPGERGGVWSGESAIVIRLDNSGAVEDLAGPADARYIPRANAPAENLLDVSMPGRDVRLLEPAVVRP